MLEVTTPDWLLLGCIAGLLLLSFFLAFRVDKLEQFRQDWRDATTTLRQVAYEAQQENREIIREALERPNDLQARITRLELEYPNTVQLHKSITDKAWFTDSQYDRLRAVERDIRHLREEMAELRDSEISTR